MKKKIVFKDSTISNVQMNKYNLAKKKANSIVAEGAINRIRRMRYHLINEGYGITIVTTYALLTLIAGDTSLESIITASRDKCITATDMINKAKENKDMFNIVDVA